MTVAAQSEKEQFIEQASKTVKFIAEGKVIQSESFWDKNHNNIYTSYTLKVSKTLKGELPSEINILVEGGKIDSIWQLVSTSIELHVGDKGVFLLEAFNSSEISTKISNCFIVANGNNGTFLTNNKFIQTLKPDKLKSTLVTHQIDSIFPKVVTAGTGTLLNIYGAGFGEIKDTNQVWFTYSGMNNSFYTSDYLKYKYWSDNLIQLEVPYKAATGKIMIKINGKDAFSKDALTVRYAWTNFATNSPVNLIDIDNKGGYTWNFSPSTNAFPKAKEIVKESINDWICATSVPWKIGNDIDTEQAYDGLCTISFDKIATSGHRLGKTSTMVTSYPYSGDSTYVLIEVDIVLSSDIEWCFSGNCENIEKHDFKSTILHELAHAHLIAHVNDENDLMHYGLAKGETRSIGETNIECGKYIVNLCTTLQHPVRKTITPYEFTQPLISVDGDILTSEYEFQNYQWCNQNGEIADANNQTYTINKSGDYYLVASNEFGCSKISELVTIVRTGNNEIKSHNDFLLYPNPVKNKLTIKFQANKFTEVTLQNTMGQQIFRAQIEPDTKQQEINFEKLKSGIFIVNLQNVNEKITSKIVIKK